MEGEILLLAVSSLSLFVSLGAFGAGSAIAMSLDALVRLGAHTPSPHTSPL